MRRFLAMILCMCFLVLPVRAAEEEKLVALTFDDGPSGRFTRRLLTGLAERDAKATFLLCGYRMEIYPDITRQILAEGHEIGLHGYSHEPMEVMSQGQLLRELERTLALVPAGAQVRFLRAPGGSCAGKICQTAAQMGVSVLLWSVDPRDWATEDAHSIEAAVLDTARDGDVILLHDMSDSSVDAALAILDQLRAQGFRFVTVSELAQRRGINTEPGNIYSRFPR